MYLCFRDLRVEARCIEDSVGHERPDPDVLVTRVGVFPTRLAEDVPLASVLLEPKQLVRLLRAVGGGHSGIRAPDANLHMHFHRLPLANLNSCGDLHEKLILSSGCICWGCK